MNLQTSILSAGGIYKRYAPRLEKLGIINLADFLYHIPARYDDFSHVVKIGETENGQTVSVRATVLSMSNVYTRKRMTIQKAIATDGTGTVEITWFNQPYLTRQIKTNDIISLAGNIEQVGAKLTMQSPEFEIITDEKTPVIHTVNLVPVYHATQGISSKWLRKQIHKLLTEDLKQINEILPDEIKIRFNFLGVHDALQQIHFPKNYEEIAKAKERLAFDELFLLQLQSMHRRHLWRLASSTQTLSVDTYKNKIGQLVKSLPFQLTLAQEKALESIFQDVRQTKPMNRLLQGDVGSGKTIVAAIAMYLAILNNKQAVLMAPTEILAEQHYATIKKLLEPLGARVKLVTGSTKNSSKSFVIPSVVEESLANERNESQTSCEIPPLASLGRDDNDILIGTHALLFNKADFTNAGLVVIDEQQRFGVEQRATIREKGNNPHVLTMTATPIPRTMALTIYGDLDLSYLDEMPIGRKKIKTWLVPVEKRESAYNWIRQQIKQTDSQVFIICPFIEESESMQTIKAAKAEYEKLQKDIFPDLKLGLLHGKMKAKEKDAVLADFKNKKYDILVATPVVEVGIDIANATIMVIEASERFGLSQLHQLRGRVGRGDKQSYCLLFTESKNIETFNRLKAMETLHTGTKLAELDLKLRGTGDLYGTLQSGYQTLKIASFSDSDLIAEARHAAKEIYGKLDEFSHLKELIIEKTKNKISQD